MHVALLYPGGMTTCWFRVLATAAALTASVCGQRDALVRAVQDAEARSVRTGVAVCDSEANILFRHRAGEAFAPASNMKLLTAAVVLSGLGANYEFVTEFLVEDGALIVRASADPNWIAGGPNDPAKLFAGLAARLRSRGAGSLRAVQLDAGTFTGPSRPDTWPQDQLYAYYCAPTGPFVLQQGTFVVGIKAGGGSRAQVSLVAPAAGYDIRGVVQEVGVRKGATYGAIDEGGAIRVRGKFYRKSPRVEIKTSMKDPSRWYRDALLHHLAKGGVRLDANGSAPSLGVVFVHRTSLLPAVRRMLEESSNFDAEQCLRVYGAESVASGSLAGGREALHSGVKALVGRVPEGVVIADGSGLSRENRLTPGLLVVAMYELDQLGLGAVMIDSLPISGRTGTLSKRFLGSDLVGKVRAKTGWIRGASSLSGVVESDDGSRRWFSILMNYDRSVNGLNKHLKKIQERIVAAVAGMKGAR